MTITKTITDAVEKRITGKTKTLLPGYGVLAVIGALCIITTVAAIS